MTLTDHDVDTKKAKKAGVSATKRGSRKKDKDKPKRPLSAYNYFFKTERQRILNYLAGKADRNAGVADEDEEQVVDAEEESKLLTDSGKVSFEEMGKLIGRRWKNISPEKLENYSKMASMDAERYKKELAEYNDRKEKGAIHEAQRQAMMQMQHGAGQNMGPGYGRPDYYQPPPYHAGSNPPPGMNMYGAPYNGGMGGPPPYMGGSMYHNPPYGGGSGYPDYNPNPSSNYSGPVRGNPPLEPGYAHSQGVTLPHTHAHTQSHNLSPGGPNSSNSYPNNTMDPYVQGPNDYSQSSHLPREHSGAQSHVSHGAPQAQSYDRAGGGGYMPQQYAGHGGSYGGPSSYPHGGPQDQHHSGAQVSHQRWG